MRYEAAKDTAISVLMFGTMALILGTALVAAMSFSVLPLLITVLPIGLLLWMYFGTYYEFRDEYLYARSGPLSERIRYDRITRLRKCRNLFSSMALAADRIEIGTGPNFVTGTTYISPRDRDEFLTELVRRCPNAKVTA
jgi:uncharacterized membrane protein YdbT with pleckstrin-like domain